MIDDNVSLLLNLNVRLYMVLVMNYKPIYKLHHPPKQRYRN